MSENAIFNATVCIIGIGILFIHALNVLVKKDRPKDGNRLLYFLLFTVLHFATYLTFTLIKAKYTSDPYIISFYTTFYIFNNIEALLFFLYTIEYIELENKTKKILTIANLVVFSIFVVLDLVNIFTGMFFTSVNGEYTRSKTMLLSQGYQLVLFILVFVITVFNKKLNLREKLAFGSYCVLPLIAIILQNTFKGYAIAYLSIIVAIEMLFLFLNLQKSIQLAQEQEKNKEAQVKIMMSQIQPHFMYNSLSSISTLIPLNQYKAQKALDDFTEYLRHNLSSLTQTSVIPFEDELRHIQTYVSLEKVRFNDRLNVVYDIQTTDFYVPPLSLQPLVENAVKHGILKKVEGGTLLFKTEEVEDAYIVSIRDDGVGFNPKELHIDTNKHFGISNIKHRLKTMCHSELLIKSEPGKGTLATVKFYKEKK